eukprot:TRINITY_DN58390_c0_g1_i1.p2 TRINITY_DN58390_c0_g1~~TRINITY_DN58390_c0_g1_i1.p2  ORF type:complete len:113 (+),score=27.34 TRINITY_DN58390_c0_g1_i1:92-430(+)
MSLVSDIGRVFFFFKDTATTEIYTRSIVGSVRCVQETGSEAHETDVSANKTKNENIKHPIFLIIAKIFLQKNRPEVQHNSYLPAQIKIILNTYQVIKIKKFPALKLRQGIPY